MKKLKQTRYVGANQKKKFIGTWDFLRYIWQMYFSANANAMGEGVLSVYQQML